MQPHPPFSVLPFLRRALVGSALASLGLALLGTQLPARADDAASDTAPAAEFTGMGPTATAVQPTDTVETASGTSGVGIGDIGTGLARGAAVGAAFLIADRAVREGADAIQGPTGDAVARRAKWIGTWRSSSPYLLGGTLAVSLAIEGTDGLATSAAIVAGALAGSTANGVVNVSVGRHRPLEERGSLAFNPLRGHTSFPSGHAAFTFALAGAIDEVTEARLPGLLAYGAAAMTGLSRIYDDRHWFSDVAVGAVVGATVSRATARRVRAALVGERAPELEGSPGGPDRAGERGTVGRPGPPSLTAGPDWVGIEIRF